MTYPVLLRSHDYVLDVEIRFREVGANVEWTDWDHYRRLNSGYTTLAALDYVDRCNRRNDQVQFRLVGLSTDTVKELIT